MIIPLWNSTAVEQGTLMQKYDGDLNITNDEIFFKESFFWGFTQTKFIKFHCDVWDYWKFLYLLSCYQSNL